jgi:beta-propeller repeat-containing protein
MRFLSPLVFCLSAFAASPARLLDNAPMRFEPNRGQLRSAALWSARGPGYWFAFTSEAALLRLGDRAVGLKLEGANPAARFEGSQPASAANYFTGDFHNSVPAFERLRRRGVYPGIDVVYYGRGSQLEYDFEIAPGADPSKIAMRFEGADQVRLNPAGQVVLTLDSGTITQQVPVVYQRRSSGEVVSVEARYRTDDAGLVRLVLGGYDPAVRLVVDPSIGFAYLAGSGADTCVSIGHDSHGFIYLAGNTYSLDFQIAGDFFQPFSHGAQDAWFMKVNPAATSGDQVIVYSTYFGGSAADNLAAMAVDANGIVYTTGSTASSDFPTTPGAYRTSITAGTNHVFVSVFDPSQGGAAGLIYSTELAGGKEDEAEAIAVAGGKIYITGRTVSTDFPMVHAFQSALIAGNDAFIAEIDPSQPGTAALVASTYLGGSGDDIGRAIAVDAQGLVYVAGSTFSADLPTSSNAYQPEYASTGEIFLTRLDLSGGTVVYSTYLGGSGIDDVKKIVLEPSGRVALTGYTMSPDFPVTQNAWQPMIGDGGAGVASNAFLTILDPSGQPGHVLIYSTYFGGSGAEVAYDLRRDSAGKYYLCGYTLSRNLPVTGNALNSASAGAGTDGFLAIIDPAAPPLNSLIYSTYITGPGVQVVSSIDVDVAGNVYAGGTATTDLFPNVVQKGTPPGNSDVFLLIFNPAQP